MLDLTGRVALVTGGTSGIGRAIAASLLAHGAHVAITSRSVDRAEAAAGELEAGRSGSGSIEGYACDVRDPDACRETVERVVDRFGGLHILINNAGSAVFKSIREMSVDEWEGQVRTNLDGVFHQTKAAVEALVEADDAWIVNIGSLAGRNSFAGGVGYNASKFGLLGMTEAMMLDLRHDGIRTSIVMPGSVDTGFAGGDEKVWAIQPQDIADAVIGLMAQPERTLISRIEVRPTTPPKK